jgi:hypothetical protein
VQLQQEQQVQLQQVQLQRVQLRQEQQLPEPEPSQREPQQEQQLLLFCRKRSWKQPGAQPGVRNISFDFPLLTYIKTHTRDRSGTCNPADAANSNKSAKENHYLPNFFYYRSIALFNSNNCGLQVQFSL